MAGDPSYIMVKAYFCLHDNSSQVLVSPLQVRWWDFIMKLFILLYMMKWIYVIDIRHNAFTQYNFNRAVSLDKG